MKKYSNEDLLSMFIIGWIIIALLLTIFYIFNPVPTKDDATISSNYYFNTGEQGVREYKIKNLKIVLP